MNRTSRNAFVLCLLLTGCAPRAAPSPGAELLDEAIEILRDEPLGREKVDWDAVRAELMPQLAAQSPSNAAHSLIGEAVARLHDDHASFAPPAAASAWRTGAAVTTDAPASAAPASPPIPTEPSVSVLDDDVAFVTVPLCGTGERAALERYAVQLRDGLQEAAAKGARAWVVDLRFNGGGNVWPMLLGLQPLLGDGTMCTSLRDGTVSRRFVIEGDAVFLDDRGGRSEQLRIREAHFGDTKQTSELIATDRVAVLIGPWTMSSGEFIAASFRGDPRVRLFGERTAGLTTETTFFDLRDGSRLTLPVARLGDRQGQAVPEQIVPDEALEAGPWPAPDDLTAQRARAWARGVTPSR